MARKDPTENLTFEVALKRFKTANLTAMTYARICAEMGIDHFLASGDLVYCQQFLEAMEQNWNRRAAYLRWLVDHVPVVLEEGVLKKDKRPEAIKLSQANIDAAKAKPFWEYLPEPAIVNFGIEDIDTALRNVIKRFHNERMVPADDKVLKYLDTVQQKLDTQVLQTPPPEPKTRGRQTAASNSVH